MGKFALAFGLFCAVMVVVLDPPSTLGCIESDAQWLGWKMRTALNIDRYLPTDARLRRP